MLPPMLTARPGPQTLLLTALALLIAVATIMLACGPVAQPLPDAGDTLAAAPQAEDGGEEPAAEPEEPTATPTVEPTDTPVPNSTECVSLSPKYQDTPELAEGQLRIDGIAYQCFVVTPTPTPKYPELGQYNWIAVAGEEAAAQRDASQAGGASGQSEVEIPAVWIRVTFSNQASADAAFTWLQNKGVPRTEEVNESWRGGIDARVVAIYSRVGDHIDVVMPASLMVPLSRQEGFVRYGRPSQLPMIPRIPDTVE